MSGGGYLKLHRSADILPYLLRRPNAWALLTLIAIRARREDGVDPRTGIQLQAGEALIGDYEILGLTEKAYRIAKNQLFEAGITAYRRANRGTIAKIVDSRIYDINAQDGGDQKGDQEGEWRGGQRGDKQEVKKKKKNNSPLTPHTEEDIFSDDSLPEEFRTSERFRQTWADWCQFRRERKKELTPTTIKKQVKALVAMGVDGAIQALDRAITNGWTGFSFGEDPRPKGRRGNVDLQLKGASYDGGKDYFG